MSSKLQGFLTTTALWLAVGAALLFDSGGVLGRLGGGLVVVAGLLAVGLVLFNRLSDRTASEEGSPPLTVEAVRDDLEGVFDYISRVNEQKRPRHAARVLVFEAARGAQTTLIDFDMLAGGPHRFAIPEQQARPSYSHTAMRRFHGIQLVESAADKEDAVERTEELFDWAAGIGGREPAVLSVFRRAARE